MEKIINCIQIELQDVKDELNKNRIKLDSYNKDLEKVEFSGGVLKILIFM